MRDHHFYIIVALLLLVLYCMMYHSKSYVSTKMVGNENFYDCDNISHTLKLC
jgi:hypothetical protein